MLNASYSCNVLGLTLFMIKMKMMIIIQSHGMQLPVDDDTDSLSVVTSF